MYLTIVSSVRGACGKVARRDTIFEMIVLGVALCCIRLYENSQASVKYQR